MSSDGFFICGIYLSLHYYDFSFSKFCKANIKRVCGSLVGGLPASALDRDTWQPSTTSNPKHLKPRFFLFLVFVCFDSYMFLLWNGPKFQNHQELLFVPTKTILKDLKLLSASLFPHIPLPASPSHLPQTLSVDKWTHALVAGNRTSNIIEPSVKQI